MRISPQSRAASVELSEQMSGSIADSTGRPSVNQDAFRVFYSRTKGSLWAYLLRISRLPDVADDLLQESYCRFLSAKLPEMDAAESRSYLFRIATNLLRDRWRRGEATEFGHTTDPSHEDNSETRKDGGRGFAMLNPREPPFLWVAHVEGYDHKEIARLLGLKAASIRVLLFRARGELASILRGGSRNEGGG